MLCICNAIEKSKHIVTRADLIKNHNTKELVDRLGKATKDLLNIKERRSPPTPLKTKLFFEELMEYEKCGFIDDPATMTYEQIVANKLHRIDVKGLVNDNLGIIGGIDWYKITKWFNAMEVTTEIVKSGVCLLKGYGVITDITLLVAVFVASKFYEDYTFYNADIARETNINRESIDFYEIDILRHNNWVVHPLPLAYSL